ncbi:MAG: isoaspartyl peptidase/L-asparaginase [Planctomycetia bacterium]
MPAVPAARPSGPVLLVHAGAWDMPEEEREPHRRACAAALAVGWAALRGGAPAVEAVARAIEVLEDDPAVNAGTGSVLTREGWVELDAGLMDGRTQQVGAVIGLRTARHPIAVARSLLGAEHVLLSGAAAEQAVRAGGHATQPPEAFVTQRERARLAAWRADAARRQPGGSFGPAPSPAAAAAAAARPADTVGALALDLRGQLAAGLSTGGACGKPSGRVGDAPIPACGYWADGEAAAACTGWGESILRVALARRAAELATAAGAEAGARAAIDELGQRVGGLGGLILLRRDGSLACAFNTPRMARGWMHAGLAAPCVEA